MQIENRDLVLEIVRDSTAMRERSREERQAVYQRIHDETVQAQMEADAERAEQIETIVDIAIKVFLYIFLLVAGCLFYVGAYMGTIQSYRAGILTGICMMCAVMVAAWKKK